MAPSLSNVQNPPSDPPPSDHKNITARDGSPAYRSLSDPVFAPSSRPETSAAVTATIARLALRPHIEGGYFAPTHTHPSSLPSPYPAAPLSQATLGIVRASGGGGGGVPLHLQPDGSPPATRPLSTTIHYLLTPHRPLGRFHRNRSTIVHALHRGRARYVLIHPGGRVETFVAGPDLERGERCQWVVDGGVFKACFLLPDSEGGGDGGGGGGSGGLLITETTVPGFDFCDHEFLEAGKLRSLVTEEEAAELDWLVRRD